MSDAARLGSDALVAQRRFLISPDWRLWAIVGVLAIIDIIWVQLTPLTIQWWIYAILLMVAGCCLAWWCAGLFFRMSDGPRRLASIVAFSWISAAAVQLCSILLMTLPFPIADPVLARWDEALGLDWVAYARRASVDLGTVVLGLRYDRRGIAADDHRVAFLEPRAGGGICFASVHRGYHCGRDRVRLPGHGRSHLSSGPAGGDGGLSGPLRRPVDHHS
jgi:hypothetical protein